VRHTQTESEILEREEQLRAWFTQRCDPIQRIVDGLDVGWGGVQRWATDQMPPVEGTHLDIACGYATFLAQLGWRVPAARLVGLNIDFDGPHALAQPLLAEARVAAELVQADARRLPFVDGAFRTASCFLGLQDVEIGFGAGGVRQAVSEAVRVLCPGGALALIDEFSFDRLDALLSGLPAKVTGRGERAPDVRWNRQVAERAIQLYAEGWVAQARNGDSRAQEQIYHDVHCRMAVEMERQLALQGYYVPFGPVRLVVTRKARSTLSTPQYPRSGS
jgi:ubiquinone/menaquinone biosynthesis C-methylase UbiE